MCLRVSPREIRWDLLWLHSLGTENRVCWASECLPQSSWVSPCLPPTLIWPQNHSITELTRPLLVWLLLTLFIVYMRPFFWSLKGTGREDWEYWPPIGVMVFWTETEHFILKFTWAIKNPKWPKQFWKQNTISQVLVHSYSCNASSREAGLGNDGYPHCKQNGLKT